MPALLLVFALVWLVQNFSVETKHAARGTISPRWQRKLARAGVGAGAPRYGSRDFMADLWGDMLQRRTEARRVARSAPESGRRTLRERLRGVWNAWDSEAERERPHVERGSGLAPHVRRARGIDPEADPAGRRTTPQIPRVTDIPCDECGTECRVIDYDPEGGSVLCTTCQWVPPAPIPDPDVADGVVTPMFNRTKREKDDMSTVTDSGAEAGTFLVTAVAHCRAVADAHASHAESAGEEFIESMRGEGVGENLLALVYQAQQASQAAADDWTAAATALEDGGLDVKDAYDRNPDVGSKEHVTGGE